MAGINVAFRRKITQRVIDRDPWTVIVYRKGRHSSTDAEVSFTLTGTIKPAGARGVVLEQYPVRYMPGEGPASRYGWVLLAPYHATDRLRAGDEIVATRTSTARTRKFGVVYAGEYAEKQEVVMDERQ